MEENLNIQVKHKVLPPAEWEQLLARLREIDAPVYHWRETPASITMPSLPTSNGALVAGYVVAGRPDGPKAEVDEVDGPRLTDGQAYAGWLERKGDTLELWTIWCAEG